MWYVFAYLGPRPTHGRSLGWGSYLFVKGRTPGRALSSVTAKRGIERMALDNYHRIMATPVLKNGGIYCVYHTMDRSLCTPLHEDD